jgi:hypothetical protein
MTPKQTAIFRTLSLVATAVIIGFLVNVAVTYFTMSQIGIGFVGGIMLYLLKMVYDFELEKAERLEKLNKE